MRMAIHSLSRGGRGRAVAALFASTMIWPSALFAQSATEVLPPTREEVTRPVAPPNPQRSSRLEVEGELEKSPCALEGPEFQSVRFTLNSVQFEGLKGMTPEELAPSYSDKVGQDLPISAVCEIRDRAATMLRSAGYIAAVQIPEQRIENGVVHFQVLIAHLAKVQVRGDATGAEKIIAGYLERLTREEVFNRYQAERYLLLASEIPGYTVRLALRPAGTTPGEVIGDVTVQRQAAYADFNVQDYGSKALGRWGALARAQLFGLTGMGDRTSLAVFTTADLQEQQTIQLGHDFRVGAEGLTFGGTFTYAWAHPDIEDANIRARTLLATIQADYPLIRSLDRTLRGSLGMDLTNQNVRLDGINLTRDKLRVAFLRLSLDTADNDFSNPAFTMAEPPWRLSAVLEARKGLHILGATPDCGPLGLDCIGGGKVPPSRVEGQSDATVLRLTGFGELRPIPKLTFALGVRGQYAWKPLLSFEEFSAGNYTTGRGYDPGTILGDRGFGSQLELRYGSRIPASARRPAIEGYAFWDHASVSNKDRLVVVDQSNHLNSAGVGARVTYDRFALDAGVAVPMTRVGIDDKKPDPRFLISLTTRLWPWSYQ